MRALDADTLHARMTQALIAGPGLARGGGRGKHQRVAGRREYARRLAQGPAPIEHHAQRLARRFDAHVESRIVGAARWRRW